MRNELLDRIRKSRENRPDELLAIAAGDPASERFAALVRNIERSLLPRQVRVSGDGFSLTMLAAHHRLYSAEVLHEDEQLMQFDFDAGINARQQAHLMDEFSRVLSIFSGAPVALSLEFRHSRTDLDETRGIGADGLRFIADANDELAPENLVLSEQPGTAMPGARALPDVAVPVPVADRVAGPSPFEILDAARDLGDLVTYFSSDGPEANPHRVLTDEYCERAGIPALTEWYDKVSPTLGEEIVMMIIPESSTEQVAVFALNSRHGIGLKMRRQAIGRLTQIVQKAIQKD